MARLGATDLGLTETGDLMLDDNGELSLVSGISYLAQQVFCRLKSVAHDWFYDHIGADLEQFLGSPNTRETAEALVAKVTNTLIYDDLLEPHELFIQPVPLSRELITLFVFIKTHADSEPICFQLDVDLEGRVTITRPALEAKHVSDS